MNKEEKQIKPMLCPICGKFHFSELNQDDIEIGISPNSVQCSSCGWFYDLEQVNNPNLKNQSNEMSLNEYKNCYKNKIKQNPKYNYIEEHIPEPTPHRCPVCGEYEFPSEDSYDICPICGWEDDGYFEGGGANDMSLEEAKDNFKQQRTKNPKYKWAKEIK